MSLKLFAFIYIVLSKKLRFKACEEDVILPKLMSGFRDCCMEAGTEVRGGQTTRNPWVLLGKFHTFSS